MAFDQNRPWPAKAWEISAPGRICLFGEHQDYLGLPVIAAAINLRIHLRAVPISTFALRIELPDIGKQRVLRLDDENPYENGSDYLAAAINILLREGVRWSCGYEVRVHSTIPINSGASSSSALQVAWCAFLLAAAEDPRAQDPVEIAKLAYQSEVLEFKAPGGMMDHFASALGGVIWLDTTPPFHWVALNSHIGEFVLVDSGIPKDTTGVLSQRRKALEALQVDFSAWKTAGFPDVQLPASLAHDAQAQKLFEATVANARLTEVAKDLLCHPGVQQEILGNLLTQQHENLSRHIKVSHPVIDKYLRQGLAYGALGGKINGSGCGGSFFLLAPAKGRLLQAFYKEHMGLNSWIVTPSEGVIIAPIKATTRTIEVGS